MNYAKIKEKLLEIQELMSEVQKAAEFIFPELKESEEDSIRNGLIALLKFGLEDNSAIAPGFNVTKEQALAWLESQGKQSVEPKWRLEKQGTQPADKIERKFKVGDWIVQEKIGVYKVIEICESWYEVIDNKDNHYSISFDKEYMCHLWTIADAKDGDVLDCEGCEYLLFKSFSNTDGRIKLYCWYNVQTNNFHGRGTDSKLRQEANIRPATKEQRDLLFSKMKEAGYEWEEQK